MKTEDIINAYCKIRTIDNTIPDEVLDFMKDTAIEKLQVENKESFPTDEEINDMASKQVSLYLKARNNPTVDLHKRFRLMAVWMRDQIKKA